MPLILILVNLDSLKFENANVAPFMLVSYNSIYEKSSLLSNSFIYTNKNMELDPALMRSL